MCENTGTGLQKNGSMCSALMGQNLKYLAAAEGGLSAKELESSSVISACRQQRSTVETRFRATVLKMQYHQEGI